MDRPEESRVSGDPPIQRITKNSMRIPTFLSGNKNRFKILNKRLNTLDETLVRKLNRNYQSKNIN